MLEQHLPLYLRRRKSVGNGAFVAKIDWFGARFVNAGKPPLSLIQSFAAINLNLLH